MNINTEPTQPKWLEWAKELQFIAQAGLAYSDNAFDRERFGRIREIAAEIVSHQTDLPYTRVTDLFCNETGFQTPKLDTRAAIFDDSDRILLVQESDGRWAMPGGWVDVNQTLRSNIIKEVKEEAGLDVEPIRIIALQDYNRHNKPACAYNICRVIIHCRAIGGQFIPNLETIDCGFFTLDNLPPLAENKTTRAQLELCLSALHNPHWQTVFE